MNYRTSMIVGLPLVLLAATSQAEPFDGKGNLLCTATEVHECDAAHACRLLPDRDAQDIRHLNVDLKKKEITLAHVDASFSSAIQSIKTVDGKLILQGIEDGRPDEDDGGGWTMSIDATWGTMIFTQAGGVAAFIGFGGCVPKS